MHFDHFMRLLLVEDELDIQTLLCWRNQRIPFCSWVTSYYRNSLIRFEAIGEGCPDVEFRVSAAVVVGKRKTPGRSPRRSAPSFP